MDFYFNILWPFSIEINLTGQSLPSLTASLSPAMPNIAPLEYHKPVRKAYTNYVIFNMLTYQMLTYYEDGYFMTLE